MQWPWALSRHVNRTGHGYPFRTSGLTSLYGFRYFVLINPCLHCRCALFPNHLFSTM
jgi:hypothetical protein